MHDHEVSNANDMSLKQVMKILIGVSGGPSSRIEVSLITNKTEKWYSPICKVQVNIRGLMCRTGPVSCMAATKMTAWLQDLRVILPLEGSQSRSCVLKAAAITI